MGYFVMESFGDHIPASLPLLSFTAVGQSDKVRNMSQTNLFRFVMNRSDEEGACIAWRRVIS